MKMRSTHLMRVAWMLSLATASCDACSDEPPRTDGVLESHASPGTATCKVDPDHPALMQRGGTADITLEGKALAVKRTGVPAVCGPLFNRTVEALNVRAGQGLLFDTCFEEGTLQITDWDYTEGKQRLHGMATGERTSLQGGTEIAFNRNEGETFTSRGEATDSLVVSEGGFKAEARVTLRAVDGSGDLKATLLFDCTKGPAAVMPEEEVTAAQVPPAQPVDERPGPVTDAPGKTASALPEGQP